MSKEKNDAKMESDSKSKTVTSKNCSTSNWLY